MDIMVLQQSARVLGENCEKYADLLERPPGSGIRVYPNGSSGAISLGERKRGDKPVIMDHSMRFSVLGLYLDLFQG